jgi:TetR/AcrR family transcriptional regulator, transcriptional repressor for nem operon
MARPREFDVEKVLREAMEVFWEKGFDGTSFADVEARTGVKKASLFAAYGDKRSLFLKALAAYQEWGRAAARAALAAAPPRVAIRCWFAGAAGGAKGDCARRGCLQVNAIVELGPHDADVDALAREHTALMREMVAEAIERGQRAGEIRTDVPAATLATYLLTALHGLSIGGKAGMCAEDVDGIAGVALSALDP